MKKPIDSDIVSPFILEIRKEERAMNQLQSISRVSREQNVSTRMIRYYERQGLIFSEKREGYAYRVYSEENVARLRQILVLRKLQIPLKDIAVILREPRTAKAMDVLQRNLDQLEDRAQAIERIRGILRELLAALKALPALPTREALLSDKLLELTDALLPPSNLLEKEHITMEELNRMDKAANKLTDVRIVYLPASPVAAAHFICDNPEDAAGQAIAAFVRENRLWERHPGLRLYGFNHPNPTDETGAHGYEFWVTIPDDMEVQPPLQKKHFPGGTYAAHSIQMGNFHEWAWLDEWVRESREYEYNGSGSPEDMFGSLEEHLNYHQRIMETPAGEPEIHQLDLLIPVRRTGTGR